MTNRAPETHTPTTNPHPPGLHSTLGASAATRWLKCPGSVRLLKTIPQTESSYAAEGSGAHGLAEWCLNNKKDAHQYGKPVFQGIAITEEMIDAVQMYLDYVRDRLLQLGPACELHVECRADLSSLHPDLWGTYDAMLLLPFQFAEVIDFKYGAGHAVDADCDQGAFYALHPYLHDEVPLVNVTIVQPRAPHRFGVIRGQPYIAAQLENKAKEFQAGAKRTMDPNAPLNPGPWCSKSFCSAQATCPALHKSAVAVAQADFTKRDLTPPPPHTLTPQQLGLILDQAEILEGWIKSCRIYAMNEAAAGRPPPNRKLVEGRKGARAWTDENAGAEAILALGKDPYERKVLSPAKAEKVVGKKEFAAACGDLVKQPPGKPQLAPLSDPRPALAAGAAIDFAPAEDDL